MYLTLSGREPAAALMEEAKLRAGRLASKPSLVIVLVGNDPASEVYVKKKIERAVSVGVNATLERLGENTDESTLLNLVRRLNSDPNVDGFIVQSPLPKHINYSKIVEAIDPKKDVDGWTSTNIGKMFLGLKETFLPATPIGIIKMLEYYKFDFFGKDAVVIGRGNVVGKPLSFMLLERNATVTICHSKTKDLKGHTKKADLVVSAAGSPGLLKADMVKKGAWVVDVGTTRVGDKIRGDVEFDKIIKKANCTPVPGGVGPMTVAMLITNVIDAAGRNQIR